MGTIPTYRSCPPVLTDPTPKECVDEEEIKSRIKDDGFEVYREDLIEALEQICSWLEHIKGTLEYLPKGYTFKLPKELTPIIPSGGHSKRS